MYMHAQCSLKVYHCKNEWVNTVVKMRCTFIYSTQIYFTVHINAFLVVLTELITIKFRQ